MQKIDQFREKMQSTLDDLASGSIDLAAAKVKATIYGHVMVSVKHELDYAYNRGEIPSIPYLDVKK